MRSGKEFRGAVGCCEIVERNDAIENQRYVRPRQLVPAIVPVYGSQRPSAAFQKLTGTGGGAVGGVRISL